MLCLQLTRWTNHDHRGSGYHDRAHNGRTSGVAVVGSPAPLVRRSLPAARSPRLDQVLGTNGPWFTRRPAAIARLDDDSRPLQRLTKLHAPAASAVTDDTFVIHLAARLVRDTRRVTRLADDSLAEEPETNQQQEQSLPARHGFSSLQRTLKKASTHTLHADQIQVSTGRTRVPRDAAFPGHQCAGEATDRDTSTAPPDACNPTVRRSQSADPTRHSSTCRPESPGSP